jgi:hypothetical protein
MNLGDSSDGDGGGGGTLIGRFGLNGALVLFLLRVDDDNVF